MASHNYETQLAALQKLRTYLKHVSEDLQNIIRNCNATMSALENEGLPVKDSITFLEEFWVPAQSKISEAVGIINNPATQYVNRQIQGLEDLINR